jgi:ring-1,2-phenylacetyl-CoA epoxidase subunit PaaC
MIPEPGSPAHRALYDYLLALADDELILGHRDSEWCGHAPILEEDIAFANIALDEIGHASVWYALLSDLAGEDPAVYPDRLVYFRGSEEYRCAQMVELPKGDWAFSILRQYLFDALEKLRLEHLAQSAYPPLAEASAKIRLEEIYHHRHTSAWVRRLSLGTEESHRRMQAALDELWPHTAQFFNLAAGEEALASAGYVPDPGELLRAWETTVIPFLEECGLVLTQSPRMPAQRGEHSAFLAGLLEDLQRVACLEPQAQW